MLRRRHILTTTALLAVCAVPAPAVGDPYTDAERRIVGSPEVQERVRAAREEVRAMPTVVEVSRPPSGFDWGDAGIGAAGALALSSIAAGSALMLTGRRRRRSVRVATH
jgi:hypothetical protein